MTPTPAEVVAERKAAGLTQQKAADLLGVKVRSWKRYESGERTMDAIYFESFKAKAKIK